MALVGFPLPLAGGHKVQEVDGCDDAKHHLPLAGGAIRVVCMEKKSSSGSRRHKHTLSCSVLVAVFVKLGAEEPGAVW